MYLPWFPIILPYSLFFVWDILSFSGGSGTNGMIQALKMAFCIQQQFEHINQILCGLRIETMIADYCYLTKK